MPDTTLPSGIERLPADADGRAIIERACELYGSDDVDVMSLEPAVDDGGAWVHALVWVPMEDADG